MIKNGFASFCLGAQMNQGVREQEQLVDFPSITRWGNPKCGSYVLLCDKLCEWNSTCVYVYEYGYLLSLWLLMYGFWSHGRRRIIDRHMIYVKVLLRYWCIESISTSILYLMMYWKNSVYMNTVIHWTCCTRFKRGGNWLAARVFAIYIWENDRTVWLRGMQD